MSGLFPGEKVYDDSNFAELIGDGKEILVNGERRLLAALPMPEGRNPASFSKSWEQAGIDIIPRSDWSAMLKEQAERFRRTSDFCDFEPFDQDGLPTCWAIGTAQALSIQRRIQGLPHVQLSGCSLAVPISGGHSGGWEGDSLEYAVEHGVASVATWPENNTRRALNSDPAVVADRVLHKALGWVDCGNSTDKWATACLRTRVGAFAYNWMSHVMAMCDLVEIERDSFGFRPRNSWGKWGAKNSKGFYGFNVYREGRGTPSSGYMLEQITPSAA